MFPKVGQEGQFDVVELMMTYQFMAFSINLNAKHRIGSTHCTWKKIHAGLLDTLSREVLI